MFEVKDIQYYCVGFTWSGFEPENQLPRFLKEGVWEDASDGKYEGKINSIPIGSRIAAKTTYTQSEGERTISILEIHAIGTVTENPKNGQSVLVKWDKEFTPFVLKNKGAYRSTINRLINRSNIEAIFGANHKKLTKTYFYSGSGFNTEEIKYPCFVFRKRKWNDYGFYTEFLVDYYESARKKMAIGSTKILDIEKEDTELPDAFNFLNDNFVSLGQRNGYYKDLRELVDKNIADFYLDAINDLAINKGLVDEIENEAGFKNSLIRNSEAQKAFIEGYKIYNGIPIDNVLKFTFSTQIENAEGVHSVDFDYSQKAELPYRIKILIGKNGTGKTQYIARLASTLSGYEILGKFSSKYIPSFSRVIAVSYSLFDRFPRPSRTKTYSYYYCGFQSSRGFLSEDQIQGRIKKAFNVLEKSNRIQLFGKYLSMVLSDELTLDILDEDFIKLNSKEFSLYDSAGISKYSSGQIIMILILSEVLAYITAESLLIFDEPETHLHPNSISLFIKVINRVLNKFNSYAIISTHSPQVIQEIPSKDIKIFERIGNVPRIGALNDIETFGENLNTITQRIFQTISHDEYYRGFLLKLSEEYSFEQILAMFEENSLKLGLGATIYLQSLYKN